MLHSPPSGAQREQVFRGFPGRGAVLDLRADDHRRRSFVVLRVRRLPRAAVHRRGVRENDRVRRAHRTQRDDHGHIHRPDRELVPQYRHRPARGGAGAVPRAGKARGYGDHGGRGHEKERDLETRAGVGRVSRSPAEPARRDRVRDRQDHSDPQTRRIAPARPAHDSTPSRAVSCRRPHSPRTPGFIRPRGSSACFRVRSSCWRVGSRCARYG